MHREHRASVQVVTALMLLRVGRDPCCTSLSLFDATPTATRVATQLLSQVRASVQPTRVSLCRCLYRSTPHLQPGKFSTRVCASARDLARTARDNARSYLSEVIDFCAVDLIAMRFGNVLSRRME